MNYEFQETGERTVIRVEGPIEMKTIKDFKEEVFNYTETRDVDIEVDLSAVEYIDSTGIGLLITLYKRQKQKKKTFRIVKASDKVHSLLELSSLSEVLG